uniref:Survival motor neuron protein n=1 Tax=Cacopsylla melanoneura TaxID=428564 RepID=A0A8D8LI18_9HEMI
MSEGQQNDSKVVNPTNNEDNFNLQVDLFVQTPDDSELIDAYERAVKLAKQKIIQNRPDLQELESEDNKTLKNENANQNVNNGNKSNKSKKKKGKNNKSKWSRGKNCRAVYSEDNKEYEATICHLSPEQDECVVKFIGYGNKESVPLSSLKPSHGPDAVLDQKFRTTNVASTTASELNESFYSPSSACDDSARFIPFDSSRPDNSIPANMSMPPLPPPAFLAGQPLDSTESLSAVLMAWYMAGYHTGRYEASLGLNKNKPYGRL